MIRTVVRVGLLRMWHGRVALLLDFAVPIAFFTIFAFIFGGQVGLGKSPRVDVALVDDSSRERNLSLMLLHVIGPLGEKDPVFPVILEDRYQDGAMPVQ